ncbi:MAG: hypothetical protein FJX53_15690 [Alphaproteobacteria bacterium]|nr:hypothetical protein [Alphaproteobacteria bacterium]
MTLSRYGIDGWPAILAGQHMLRWIGERYTLDPMQTGHGVIDYRYEPRWVELGAVEPARAAALLRHLRAIDDDDYPLEGILATDVDLNGDRQFETLVGLVGRICGTIGCDGYVLSSAPEMRNLGQFTFHSGVTLWPERIDGWRTIQGSETGLRWNGTDYDSFCIEHRCDEGIGHDER